MEYEFKLVKLSKTNLFDNTQSVEDNLNSNYSNGWDIKSVVHNDTHIIVLFVRRVG